MGELMEMILIGLLILFPFLLATISVHIWMIELNKLYRKYMISYLFTFLVSYLMSMWEFFFLTARDRSPVLFFPMLFSSLSTFMWLNVILMDLYFQVGNVQRYRRFSERTRWILYSLYSWLLPIGLFVVCLLIFYGLNFWLKVTLYFPNQGRAICFSVPIGLVFGVNTILYFKLKSKTPNEANEIIEGILNDGETDEESNQQNEVFKFFSVFFVVIGTAWVFDAFVSLFLYGGHYRDPFYLPVDIANIVQAAVLTVWTFSRPIVVDSIKKRWDAIF